MLWTHRLNRMNRSRLAYCSAAGASRTRSTLFGGGDEASALAKKRRSLALSSSALAACGLARGAGNALYRREPLVVPMEGSDSARARRFARGPSDETVLQFVGRIGDAYGLVLVLIITTFVVAMTLPPQGWGGRVIAVAVALRSPMPNGCTRASAAPSTAPRSSCTQLRWRRSSITPAHPTT